MQKTAFKYDVEVKEEGRVELSVPLPPGARVTVFVVKGERGVAGMDLPQLRQLLNRAEVVSRLETAPTAESG